MTIRSDGRISVGLAWLNRSPSARTRSDEAVGQQVKASFLASDRTYGHGASGEIFWPMASNAACTGSNC
jgi:hypothetical protein